MLNEVFCIKCGKKFDRDKIESHLEKKHKLNEEMKINNCFCIRCGEKTLIPYWNKLSSPFDFECKSCGWLLSTL